MTTIVKFPYNVSRRAYARHPRRSPNGTPEERAAKAAAAKSTAAALCGSDPIYAAIERHKAAGVVWDAAVDVRSRFNNLHMDDERRKQLAVLENAVDEAWEHCEQPGVDLINTGPLLRYRDLEGLLEELALVSDVCKTLFEFEMTKAKTMAERLGGDQTWAPISKDTVDRLGFLLRDLDERIELLKRDFYAADPDPEYFSHMNRDPAA